MTLMPLFSLVITKFYFVKYAYTVYRAYTIRQPKAQLKKYNHCFRSAILKSFLLTSFTKKA